MAPFGVVRTTTSTGDLMEGGVSEHTNVFTYAVDGGSVFEVF